jgi:prevent-host-death family protein
MEVNVHHAKTNLSKLISAAESGEEVIIARNGKPAVKLVPIEEKKRSRRNMLGSGIGKIWISPDFDSPETKAEIAALMEGGRDFE